MLKQHRILITTYHVLIKLFINNPFGKFLFRFEFLMLK